MVNRVLRKVEVAELIYFQNLSSYVELKFAGRKWTHIIMTLYISIIFLRIRNVPALVL